MRETISMCNRAFTISSALKVHKMVHTGEKPFQCEICKRRFITSYLLTEHNKRHTGAKPLQMTCGIRVLGILILLKKITERIEVEPECF